MNILNICFSRRASAEMMATELELEVDPERERRGGRSKRRKDVILYKKRPTKNPFIEFNILGRKLRANSWRFQQQVRWVLTRTMPDGTEVKGFLDWTRAVGYDIYASDDESTVDYDLEDKYGAEAWYDGYDVCDAGGESETLVFEGMGPRWAGEEGEEDQNHSAAVVLYSSDEAGGSRIYDKNAIREIMRYFGHDAWDQLAGRLAGQGCLADIVHTFVSDPTPTRAFAEALLELSGKGIAWKTTRNNAKL